MVKTIVAAAIALLLGAAGMADAQDWPTRAVNLVVPYAAGGPVDTIARILAAQLSESLGQQVVVENAGGAGGMTGAARVAKAAPDGYTVLLSGSAVLAINQTLYKRPLYNAVNDFEHVALFADSARVLIVRKDLPASTLPEFVAYAAYLVAVKPDLKRIAIINPDYAFGHDAAKIFTTAIKTFKPDVEVVAELFPKLGAGTYQTEISRLTAARPDVIFSNLWGGDLENFVRQASPRGLFRSSQAVLALGESSMQNVQIPEGVIVGVLGDGWWMSPDAAANPETKEFAEAYKAKYGKWPVFPAMKMANSFLYVKAAYEKAMAANGGKWPSRDEVAAAMKGSEVKTLTGIMQTRADNDGVVDQIIGITATAEGHDGPVIGNMVRYKGADLMPPAGEDPLAWIGTLAADLPAKLPQPGSYK